MVHFLRGYKKSHAKRKKQASLNVMTFFSKTIKNEKAKKMKGVWGQCSY